MVWTCKLPRFDPYEHVSLHLELWIPNRFRGTSQDTNVAPRIPTPGFGFLGCTWIYSMYCHAAPAIFPPLPPSSG